MSQKKSFDERKKSILNQHQTVIDTVRNRNYRTLLDLGCGNAYKSMVFALELAMDIVALDEFAGHGSTESLEGVRENIKQMNLDQRVQVVQGNALEVKKMDRCFDVVFTQNVLHHLFPWPRSKAGQPVEAFFRDLFDVINRGGMFYITDISPWNFWDQLSRILPGRWYRSALFSSINSVKYKPKTPAFVWMKHLRSTGFQDVRLEYHVPYPFRKIRPLLNNRFANPFVESVYTITAIKPAV